MRLYPVWCNKHRRNARLFLQTGGFRYIKNNDSYTGNADEFNTIYGDVGTCFFSNMPFLSYGEQYQNQKDKWVSIMFGKDKLTRVDKQ